MTDLTDEQRRNIRQAMKDAAPYVQRSKLGLRFNQTPMTAAQDRADRDYYRALVL